MGVSMSHYVFIEGGIAGLTEANALANVGSVILLEQSRTLGGHASVRGISASDEKLPSRVLAPDAFSNLDH